MQEEFDDDMGVNNAQRVSVESREGLLRETPNGSLTTLKRPAINDSPERRDLLSPGAPPSLFSLPLTHRSRSIPADDVFSASPQTPTLARKRPKQNLADDVSSPRSRCFSTPLRSAPEERSKPAAHSRMRGSPLPQRATVHNRVQTPEAFKGCKDELHMILGDMDPTVLNLYGQATRAISAEDMPLYQSCKEQLVNRLAKIKAEAKAQEAKAKEKEALEEQRRKKALEMKSDWRKKSNHGHK